MDYQFPKIVRTWNQRIRNWGIIVIVNFYFVFYIFIIFKSDDETGVLHQIQSQICENISLYAQKYEEEFSSYMRTLVTIIWKLLIKTGSQAKYDTVKLNFNY